MAALLPSNLSLLVVIVLLIGGNHHAVGMGMEKTEIEFYMHDIMKASKNFTTVKVTHGSPGFGLIRVIDNALTEGLPQNSKELGRARGMYVQDSLSGADLLLVLTVTFRAGEHSGSSLCLQGQDDAKQREISVVGGTGHFRHATGHAILETQLSMGAHAILKVNVSVLHRSEVAE